MQVTSPRSGTAPRRRFLDAKGWIAVAGLAFGAVQLLITIYFSQKNAALERALDEEAAYQLTVDFLHFNNRALGTLIDRIEDTSATSGDDSDIFHVSLVDPTLGAPEQESDGLAGWRAFKAMYARSLEDPEELRDQIYTFLRFQHRGTAYIRAVHLYFADGDSVVFGGIGSGDAVLVPIQLAGRHANLARVKKRIPDRAWFAYERLGRTRTIPIDIPPAKDPLTTGFPGVWQALPEFSQ